MLHELLVEAADWPRVTQCARTVPVLLHVFFNTIVTVKRFDILYKFVASVLAVLQFTICILLKKYVARLFQIADEKLLAHLILVMLERSSLLLNIPAYIKEIHRYTETLKRCRLPHSHPHLLTHSLQPLLTVSAGCSAATC